MGDTHSILLAILAVCSGGTVLASSAEPEHKPPTAAQVSSAFAAADTRTITVARGGDRLFYLDAMIADQPVRFLVDTGANITLLSAADASRTALLPGGSVTLETAGGSATISGASVTGMTIGGHPIGPLKVGIANDDLKISLLGQDALARLGTVSFTADTMVIHLPASSARID